MSSRNKPISPDELTAAQRILYHSIVSGPRGEGKQSFPLTDKAGALNGPFGILLDAPALGQALQELGSAIRYRSTVSDRVREVAEHRDQPLQNHLMVIHEDQTQWHRRRCRHGHTL